MAAIATDLRGRGIFLGADLSREQPDLGQTALVAVTEAITQDDIDRLVADLAEVLR